MQGNRLQAKSPQKQPRIEGLLASAAAAALQNVRGKKRPAETSLESKRDYWPSEWMEAKEEAQAKRQAHNSAMHIPVACTMWQLIDTEYQDPDRIICSTPPHGSDRGAEPKKKQRCRTACSGLALLLMLCCLLHRDAAAAKAKSHQKLRAAIERSEGGGSTAKPAYAAKPTFFKRPALRLRQNTFVCLSTHATQGSDPRVGYLQIANGLTVLQYPICIAFWIEVTFTTPT